MDHFLRSTLNPRYLELTLLPTEQCNFRCTYCYEDFEIGQMSPRIQAALKQFLLKRVPGIQYLNFQWFGGEPLAAKRIVYELSAFAQRLCGEHGVGFGGALTTNGYQLDRETVQALFDLGQTGYQISLDGLGEVHDHTRRLASGAGTFDRIWKNLIGLRDSRLDLSVLLRVHLTPGNIQSIRELAVELRTHFLHDPRFSVLLKPIENLGGPNGASVATLAKAERAGLIAEIRSLLNGGASRAPAPGPRKASESVCYASRPNSLVIRADGRVQKCTVALEQDHNTVGRLGDDGTIHLDGVLMKQWMRGYDTEDANDLRCPAQHFPRPASRHKTIPIAPAP